MLKMFGRFLCAKHMKYHNYVAPTDPGYNPPLTLVTDGSSAEVQFAKSSHPVQPARQDEPAGHSRIRQAQRLQTHQTCIGNTEKTLPQG